MEVDCAKSLDSWLHQQLTKYGDPRRKSFHSPQKYLTAPISLYSLCNFLNQKAVDFSKTIFVLNTYHLLLLTTQKIFYLLQNFWEKKVLQRSYILRAVQTCKDNQQRWLGCCILGIMCRNYLSNYIGYTVDGTICLKTVTWSTPHLRHLFW